MQRSKTPAPAGGGMVKAAWFPRYRAEDLPQSFDRIVQSWDTANKPTELADYSVCTTWGLKGPNFWLLNVLRKKLAYPELKRAVREQRELFAPAVILIEDKASGTQLIQDLIGTDCRRSPATRPTATRSCASTRADRPSCSNRSFNDNLHHSRVSAKVPAADREQRADTPCQRCSGG